MNKNDMDQPQIDRHRMYAGMIWTGLCLVGAIVAAILLARCIHQPTCSHPERFLESTIPTDCR